MGKFKDFYQKLQEEKLLKIKGDGKDSSKDITEPSKIKKGECGILKKEDEQISQEVLKQGSENKSNDGFFQDEKKKGEIPVVAKPVFNNVQKRNDLCATSEIEETVNYSTSLPTSYPTGPISLGTKRLITNPSEDIKNDTYSYDVTITPKNNLFSFITTSPMLFQMSENGVMKFENQWDERSIRKEIREKDKQKEDKIYDMISYINGLTQKEQDLSKEYLKYFTDYNLFWKFYEQNDSLNKDDSSYEQTSQKLQGMIDKLRHRPPTEEEDSDAFYFSNGLYDTLRNKEITIGDANKIREVFKTIEIPRITYFYPTLLDVIRIYTEGTTNVKEFSTALINIIDKHDEHPEDYGLNESLYYDIMNSDHPRRDDSGRKDKFTVVNPKRTEIIDGDLGKNPGDIVYEFVSNWDHNWNRITDKGLIIGYGKQPRFNSMDIKTCYFMSYNDLPYMLTDSPNYNTKYEDVKVIPVWLLKVGLENLVKGYVAADHPESLVRRPGKRRFV